MNEIIYPVVIVGKDRTRMTCEVVRHLHEKLLNCDPHFIIVSDRSRVGHCEAIRGFIQRELSGVGFEILETSSDRFGWGAAMNIGLERAFQISDSAILVDNDWILQRTILVDHLADVLRNTPMGCVSFKAIPKNHDYMVQERIFGNFKFDVRTETADGIFSGGRPNYVVEIGCMAISKRFFEKVGKFKENVNHTDDVEYDFISRFSKIPIDAREEENILFGNFTEFRHEQLNGPGHVFTHIGMDSQSGRKQKWEIPVRYSYLNNDSYDAALCEEFVSGNKILPVVVVGKDRTSLTKQVVSGANEHFKGCTPYFIVVSDNSREGHVEEIREYLKSANIRGIVMTTTKDCFNLGGAMRIGFKEGFGISDVVFELENDMVCRKDIDIAKYREVLQEGEFGCLSFKWQSEKPNITHITKEVCGTKIKESIVTDSSHECYPIPIGCQMVHRRFMDVISYPPNMNPPECELRAQYVYSHMNKNELEGKRCLGGIPEEFYHTSQDSEIAPFLHLGKLRQRGRNFTREEEESGTVFKIDWSKYFDKVYCIYYLPNKKKMPRLISEFRRVDLLDSPVFEWRYTTPSRYDKTILNHAEPKYKIIKYEYVNHILEVQRIIKEAHLLGLKRIAIIEDDLAFLKDKEEIVRILDDMPDNFGCVQMDKFVREGEPSKRYKQLLDTKKINSHFVDASSYNFCSAAFNVFNRHGMEECIKVMDSVLCSTDRMFEIIPEGRAVAIRNLCIQVWYDNCIATHYDTIGKMHENYKGQGIDYSDYSVPSGYGFGKLASAETQSSYPEFSVKQHSIGDKSKGRKKVSVYAIAYNESRNIDKWYSCVSEADEVVVLDTGSTDDTVEKLRKLGAYVEVEKFDKWNSVEEYDAIVARGGNPWRFDKARNDSLKLVAEDSDILVTIDIDEFMQPGWRKNLEDQWIAAEESGKHPTCAAYKYVWCYNPDGTEARTFEIHKIHARGVCHWTHMIHEVLHYDSGERPFWLKDFTVEHHQDLSKTRKSYLPMLAVEARDMPENDRSAHYYGRELMYEGRWDESIAELKRHLSLRASGWRAERAASMRYIANCYAGKRDSEMEELWLWKAAMEDPNHREASFRLGEIYMSRKDWRSAERAWEFCLNIKNRSQEYISDNRCWSAIPHLQYAQALWWDGNWRAACEQAEIAVQMEPSNKEAIAQRDGMQATRKQHNR